MMRLRVFVPLAVLLLSGCAGPDFDPLGLYEAPEPVEVVLAAPPPPPAAPSYVFCRRIAAQEAVRDNPTRDTQMRRADVHFRDCVATFGDA